MLPSELTETLRPPDSVLRLGRFLEELLECPYVFQGSNPVSFTLTLTDAESLAGRIGARYFSPILLGAAWAEYAAEHRLQMHSVRDFVFWVGRLQQAAYQEIYDTNTFGQTKLKSPNQAVQEPSARKAEEPSDQGRSSLGPPRREGFLSPSLERAAAFGLGVAAAASAQQSFTPGSASTRAFYQPGLGGQSFTPGSSFAGGYQGGPSAFVESGGSVPSQGSFSLPAQLPEGGAYSPSTNLPPHSLAPVQQGFSPQGGVIGGQIPQSVIGPLSQMEPGGIQWLVSQSSSFATPSYGAGQAAQTGLPGAAPTRPDPQRGGAQGSPQHESPGLFLPALIGAAVWLAARRGGSQSVVRPRGGGSDGGGSIGADGQGDRWTGRRGGSTWQRGGDGKAGQVDGNEEGQADNWTGRGGEPAWQRGRQSAPATARMGFATLFSAAPTFATQAEGETGSAVQLPLESLVPAGQPLTESGMSALVATLPPGASFLYPSLPPGSLGKGSINVPLAAGLADRLIQASAPGEHTGSTARMAARLAKAEAPGSSGSAPLAAKLIPTQRPSGSMGGGAASGEGMGALGSGMSQRPRSLSFLGAPVRLAPSLSGRSELQDEVRAKSGSQMSSQPMPSKPTSFSDLRTQVLGGMPTVDVEPDQQAWSQARPSMGLASSSPLEVLSGDAWNPALSEVRTGRKDASSLNLSAPQMKMGDGSVRPGFKPSHRSITTIGAVPLSKGSSPFTPPSMGAAHPALPSMTPSPSHGTGAFDLGRQVAPLFSPQRGEEEGQSDKPLGSLPSPTILKLDQGSHGHGGAFKGPNEAPMRSESRGEGGAPGSGFTLGSLPTIPAPAMGPSSGQPGVHARQFPPVTETPSSRQRGYAGESVGREPVNEFAGHDLLKGQQGAPHQIHTPTMSLDLPRHGAHQDEGTPRLPSLNMIAGSGEAVGLTPKLPLPDISHGRFQEPESKISAMGEMKDFRTGPPPAQPSVPLPGPAPLPLPKRPAPKSAIQATGMMGQFAMTNGQAMGAPSRSQPERSAETKGSSTTGIDSHEVNAMAMEVYSILRRRLTFESQRMGR